MWFVGRWLERWVGVGWLWIGQVGTWVGESGWGGVCIAPPASNTHTHTQELQITFFQSRIGTYQNENRRSHEILHWLKGVSFMFCIVLVAFHYENPNTCLKILHCLYMYIDVLICFILVVYLCRICCIVNGQSLC